MKHFRIFAAVLFLALLLTAAACAAELTPLPIPEDERATLDGIYYMALKDTDKVKTDGYFTAELYLADRYDSEAVQALAPGDTIQVNGKTVTVTEIVPQEEDIAIALEIRFKEEYYDYIVLRPTMYPYYTAVVDDWVPVTRVGSLKVTTPLREDFTATLYFEDISTRDFLDTITEYDFTQYNTWGTVDNSVLTSVSYSDYPTGPAEEADAAAGEMPVWKFFHALSPEGLDTAVITCYQTDCEVGPVPREVPESELEEIRALALNGIVTEVADYTSVTGGTWLYTFTSPEGEHLLTVELWKGMLVSPYGMYAWR